MLTRKFFKEGGDSLGTLDDEFINKDAIALEDINKGSKGRVEFKGTPWTAESNEDIKKGQVDHLLVHFNLREIGVQGKVQVHAGRDWNLGIQSGLENFAMPVDDQVEVGCQRVGIES